MLSFDCNPINSSMMIRRRFKNKVPFLFLLLCSILLTYSSVHTSAAVVTLDSIEIFKTHEWLPAKPAFYFHCKGEDKIVLPDVKEKRVSYTFKGEESWQPMTDLQEKKCHRCGFYEKDTLRSDAVLDEWEFCVSDFNRSDGKYIHFKDKQLNATFLCKECVPLENVPTNSTKPETSSKVLPWPVILVISVAASTVFVVGLFAGYNYMKKVKRQREQARFLRLFEEADDMEDELGIGPLSHDDI